MSQDNTQNRSPSYYPWEDRALKAAARLMGDELLPMLGISGKIKRAAPTEQVYLRTEDFSEDFNYEMEDGSILHLEFESDEITNEDLRRFRGYEAVLSYQQHKDVKTCVICTAKAGKLRSELKTGMNCYRVQAVRLKNWNADQIISELEARQKECGLLREELLRLILVPVMSGALSQLERIRRSFRLLRGERERQSENELQQMEAVLYTLAEKFLKTEELKSVKEEIHMTRLGQMIYEDGVEDGKKVGLEDGRKAGIEDGKKAGEERVNSLNSRLLEQNRADDVLRAIHDSEYQKKLFAEFEL